MARTKTTDPIKTFYDALARECTRDVLLIVETREDLAAVTGMPVPDTAYERLSGYADQQGLPLGKAIHTVAMAEQTRHHHRLIEDFMRPITHRPDGTKRTGDEFKAAMDRFLADAEDRRLRGRYDTARTQLNDAKTRMQKASV